MMTDDMQMDPAMDTEDTSAAPMGDDDMGAEGADEAAEAPETGEEEAA